MTPLQRKPGGHGSEKPLTRGRARVGVKNEVILTEKRTRTSAAGASGPRNKGNEKTTKAGAGAKNKAILSEKGTSTKGRGSEKKTTRGREGVGLTAKSIKFITPPEGQEDSYLTVGGRLFVGLDKRSLIEMMIREDDANYIPPDTKTMIESALAAQAKCKKNTDEEFERLEVILENHGLCAESDSEPYKYAMQKLFGGVVMSKQVGEAIGKCIVAKLEEVFQVFMNLVRARDWDDRVASMIIDTIKQVTEDVGVKFEELEEISDAAENGILKEPVRGFKLQKSEYVRDLVRNWCRNAWSSFAKFERVWVKNPTPVFSIFDPDNYDNHHVRRYQQ